MILTKHKSKIEITLIYFFHLMGVFWYASGYLGSIIYDLAGLFIIVLGLYTCYKFLVTTKTVGKSLITIIAIGLLGYGLETVGWKTGFPYGQFYYTDILKPQIYSTPLAIPFAWITLTICSTLISQNLIPSKSILAHSLVSGGLVCFLDYIMEPASIMLNYWYWVDNYIPVENYITWFFSGTVFSMILIKNTENRGTAVSEEAIKRNNVFLHVYFAQLLYFWGIRSFV